LAVGKVAARQGGVISAAQLHAAGLGRGAVHARVLAGRLLRIHRGVYAVGHAQLTALGWRWAAVLACGGPGLAVLSHRTAAAVWDLLPSPAKFDVTTLRAAHATPTIRVHRSRTLAPRDVTEKAGLPLTTVARTLVDLTATQTSQ
jgi:predicted transcriptional regulator of viral defense system